MNNTQETLSLIREPKPLAAFKYLFRFPGYLYPWQILYFGLATVTWLYFQPALSRCVTFQPDWILEMFVRNLVLLVLIFGAWHYWLWSRKSQGLQYKFPATNPREHTFPSPFGYYSDYTRSVEWFNLCINANGLPVFDR